MKMPSKGSHHLQQLPSPMLHPYFGLSVWLSSSPQQEKKAAKRQLVCLGSQPNMKSLQVESERAAAGGEVGVDDS